MLTPFVPNTEQTVLLLWRSLGPYHVARARAAVRHLRMWGLRTVVVELCDGEESRDWRVARETLEFDVHTIAPGARLTDRSRNLTAQLLRLFEEIKPCCVAVAGYDRPEMRGAFRWANRRGAGAVLMSETKWDDRPRPWWRLKLVGRQVRRADAALVSGGAAGEFLVALGMPRERIFRQYGAVDNDYFFAHAAKQRRLIERRYFLACSRLIESRKNVSRLLAAYSEYRRRLSQPWDLVICGDGPDRETYQLMVDRERIGGVTFAGFQQIESLANYYAGASCFVHPARNEAWGLVVNEALASALPVLVSQRCGCAYDLVHDGVNGFTFDPSDVAGLSSRLEQITRLTDEQREQMGEASLRIVSRFGCDQFAAGLAAAMNVACRARCGSAVNGSPDSQNLVSDSKSVDRGLVTTENPEIAACFGGKTLIR